MMGRRSIIGALLCTFGCTVAVMVVLACDDDFVPASVLTKFRTLAIRAEPPLAGRGHFVRLDALVYDPADRPHETTWLACDPPKTTTSSTTPCDDGPTLLALERAARDGALASFAPPAGMRLLDTLSLGAYSPEVAVRGTQTAIILHIAKAGTDVAITRKELLVSDDADVRSTNPVVDLIVVDGRPIAADFTGRASRGQRTEWAAVVTSSSADPYLAERPDGTREARTEDLRYRWYTTAGGFGTELEAPSIDLFRDAGPPPRDAGPREGGGRSSTNELGWKVTLTMPEAYDLERGPIRVFVVILDGRGGTTWAERDVMLRP